MSNNRNLEYLSERGQERMRVAGRTAAELLQHLGEMVKPGVSTAALDDEAERWTQDRGAISAPLYYPYGPDDSRSFPKSICTSVNDVICHGIPRDTQVLREGDIINIDVTPIVDGYHGDTSKTFCVGTVAPETQKLVDIAERCLIAGMKAVQPGGRLRDIGAAIEAVVDESKMDYGIVRDFVGHGIGRTFHTEPQVKHYFDRAANLRFKPGMCFTIEPMINIGTIEVEVLDDDWTALTADRSLSAQFEHTLMVTDDGIEVFTLLEGETFG